MTRHPRVLLVSPTASLSMSLAASIRRAGYEVTLVSTFQSAADQLRHQPSLLLTELKLAEYNGVHLALRARALGVPALVVADRSFASEVEEANAVRVSPEQLVPEHLDALIGTALQDVPVAAVQPWFGDGSEFPGPTAMHPERPGAFDVLH